MGEERQKNPDSPPTHHRKNGPHKTPLLTTERVYGFGIILLSTLITAYVLAWILEVPGFAPERTSSSSSEQYRQKIRLPSGWDSEDVILRLDIPKGWTVQNTPYQFAEYMRPNIQGEAKISPLDTSQSDPTGLTVSHFFEGEHLHYFPMPYAIKHDESGDYFLPDSDAMPEGRRLPHPQNAERDITPIGGRDALALTYDLPSPAGTHKCTERQVSVNRRGTIIRLCSPAGAETIPQDYLAFLSSAQWIPRAESDFAQSEVVTDPPSDSINIPLPDGWKSEDGYVQQNSLNSELNLHKYIRMPGTVPLHLAQQYPSHPLWIRRIPPSLISGKWAIYPTDDTPEACTPEWKKMADTWEPSGGQNWLNDRTIGGEKACGFSTDPNPQRATWHYWFIPREDGLWIFEVAVPPTEAPKPEESAQSDADPAASFNPEDYQQVYTLLDQVTWTKATAKGAK